MNRRIEVANMTYAGGDVPLSAGLLTFVEEEGMWSLRIIAKEPLNAASASHSAPIRVTSTNGEIFDLGDGHCIWATQKSRFHFAGRDPAAPELGV